MNGEPVLPALWREAFQRDAEGPPPAVADPLPERRLARVLAAYIASGLLFMLAPGTLVGVWNLVGISSHRQAEAVPAAWIQAHGHAQLFGWVATFMIGISLYALPKFRGAAPRSIPLAWVMLALWSAAVAARWFAGVRSWRWESVFPASAALELAVAALLVWQVSGAGPSHRKGQAWEVLIFAGFAGLLATLAWQLAAALGPLTGPALPPRQGRLLISLALWIFCFPVALGYGARFFPGLLGSPRPSEAGAWLTLALLVPAALGYAAGQTAPAAAATLAAVLAGCWTVRVFHPTPRKPKTSGVDPLYPHFARLAFGWLAVSAALGLGAAAPGLLGASRHAFTVGFLATLIFSIGPRILPAFLNNRELRSIRLMRASLVLLTAGCGLRVTSEPLAYGGAAAWAWSLLPVSALLELCAVVLFALNIGLTLASPAPSWFGRRYVHGGMNVYWLVTGYPDTRALMIAHGLVTLERAHAIPRSLTLGQAAAADGADLDGLRAALGEFFDARLARSARPRVQSELKVEEMP